MLSQTGKPVCNMFTDPPISQELVHENNNRQGFIDHKRDVEFSKKRGKNLSEQSTLDSL